MTVQNLICSGMDPKTENNPYLGFTYTSFQERATKVRFSLLVVLAASSSTASPFVNHSCSAAA